jgi:hypothetical protein
MNKISEKAVWDELTPSEDENTSPTSFGQPTQPQMMFCYNCSQVIPANSAFCPWCQTELFVTCPKCGNKYSSQYPSCYQCGTNREQYLNECRKIKEDRQLRRKGLIVLDPHHEDSELVDSGYYDGDSHHVYMNQLTSQGKGFNAIHNYNGMLCTEIGVVAHLNDGNGVFIAEFPKSWHEELKGRCRAVHYIKLIDDKYHWKIELTRWISVKTKYNIFGIIKDYSYTPMWDAGYCLTDLARATENHNCANVLVSPSEFMSKYGYLFWEDVRRYAKDLETFLGMSPYDFFEYYKYYEYDKKAKHYY